MQTKIINFKKKEKTGHYWLLARQGRMGQGGRRANARGAGALWGR